MTPKELKKLVKVCREVGIRTYKENGVEFTLGDIEFMPRKNLQAVKATTSKRQLESTELVNDHVSVEEFADLDPMDQLFWSAAHGVPVPEDNQG